MRVRRDDNEKLKEFLEMFVENLKDQGVLPKELSANAEQKVIQNILQMLDKCMSPDMHLDIKDFFNPDEENEPTELTRFLFLAVKVEFFKELGYKLEFEKMDSKEEHELNKALEDLKNAKTEEQVEEAFSAVLKVCEKLKHKGFTDTAMLVEMIAKQIKNEKQEALSHNQFNPKPEPKSGKKEEKDPLTDYLENLFGIDPRVGSGHKVVTIDVADPLGIGAQITRLDTENRSQVSKDITNDLMQKLGGAVSDGPIRSLLDNLPPKPSPLS